ncbi:MAG: ABC transporter permease [Candidatus Krumholzibacteriota bacterium]|nr:ABC transporter permease [Candidatus Krumholzibacteriota bacterium]
MKRVLAIARKELAHILRDRRSLAVALLMPLAMVLLYGAAIDMELRLLHVGLLDEDCSEASRELVRALTSSGFAVVSERLENRAAVEPGLRQGRFLAALIIPTGFARQLERGERAPLQILVDGSDAATAAIASHYLDAVVALENARQGAASAAGPVPRPRVWFNPQLRSPDFVVPGLVALILMMVCALLTSIAITRERENGTLEQILTTPVTPIQMVLGKVLPYVALGALDAAIILLTGKLAFGVPMAGSWWVLAAYCLLFIMIALGVGLLISARASSLRVAMIAAILATMLPSMILSGFVFPLASMPVPLRLLCQLMPATHFLVIIRSILLKGQSWFPLQTLALALMGFVLITAAVRSFRLDLE